MVNNQIVKEVSAKPTPLSLQLSDTNIVIVLL